jgi:hypothetical protein
MSRSLCEAISGTINAADFARFEAVFSDPQWRPALEKNASLMYYMGKLVTESATRSDVLLKQAEAFAARQRFDVVQVLPAAGGYTVKVSSAPDNMRPVSFFLTEKQAQEVLPPEAMQAADQTGAATMTGVEADPDPLVESAQPVTTFGMYKVMEKGTGKQIIGYVIPQLMDLMSGQMVPQALFVNGSQYATQPVVMGSLVGVNFNLPATPNIRGMGAFYKSDGRAIVVTTPVEIISEITVEGRKHYAARLNGQEIQVSLVDNLKRPTMMGPNEVAVPRDYSFMPLDSPVQLEEGGAPAMGAPAQAQPPMEAGQAPVAAPPQQAPPAQLPMKEAQAAAFPTMIEIRAWNDNTCDLRGPVFDKIGSGVQSWTDAVFFLAAAGVPQNLSVALLEKSAGYSEAIRLYGLHPLSTTEERVERATKVAHAKLANVKLPKVCLLKEAAALADGASVDSVLALNFINPDNVETFVEFIPDLEETATKLASLVLASQMGLQTVPQQAAVRAMFAIENVVSALKDLQTHHI